MSKKLQTICLGLVLALVGAAILDLTTLGAIGVALIVIGGGMVVFGPLAVDLFDKE